MIPNWLRSLTSKSYYDSGIIRETMVLEARKGTSFNRVQGILRSNNLGYKRQEMQEDYRSALAFSKAKTYHHSGAIRAETFFRNKIEPLRSREGLTIKEAYKKFHKWKGMKYETAEEAKALEETGKELDWATTP